MLVSVRGEHPSQGRPSLDPDRGVISQFPVCVPSSTGAAQANIDDSLSRWDEDKRPHPVSSQMLVSPPASAPWETDGAGRSDVKHWGGQYWLSAVQSPTATRSEFETIIEHLLSHRLIDNPPCWFSLEVRCRCLLPLLFAEWLQREPLHTRPLLPG